MITTKESNKVSNWNKESILKFLEHTAPNAPLKQCLTLASDFEELKHSEFHYKQMLACLSTILLDDNGNVLEKFNDVRPAIKKALEAVSYCHSWTVCGPVDNGIERMMCDIEGIEYGVKPKQSKDICNCKGIEHEIDCPLAPCNF